MATITSEPFKKFNLELFHNNIQKSVEETFDAFKLFEKLDENNITMAAFKSLEAQLENSRGHLKAFTNENMYTLITLTRSTGAKQLQGAVSNLAFNIDRLSHLKDKFNGILNSKCYHVPSDQSIGLGLSMLRSPEVHEKLNLPQVDSPVNTVEILDVQELARKKRTVSFLKHLEKRDKTKLSISSEGLNNPRRKQLTRSPSAPDLQNTKKEIEDLHLSRSKSCHSESDPDWERI